MGISSKISILFLVLASLWGSMQFVVGAKFLELQVYIEKEMLQNFELSSQALEITFQRRWSGDENIKSEIKEHVISMQVLNEADKKIFELSLENRLGVAIINSIRLLSFRPLILFFEEREFLLLLKYAFYLERNFIFDKAVNEYDLFIKGNAGNYIETVGFALLHRAYCNGFLGNIKKAIASTNLIINKYPGTHYSRTAYIIRKLLLRKNEQIKLIESSYSNPQEKALAYFRSGNFKEARKIYLSMNDLSTPIDRYRFARSKEWSGQIESSIEDYKDITKNKLTEAAKLANQRLLMIAHFYGGGNDLREYAKKNAKRLGNVDLLKSIKFTKTRLPELIIAKEVQVIQEARVTFIAKNIGDIEILENKKLFDSKIKRPEIEQSNFNSNLIYLTIDEQEKIAAITSKKSNIELSKSPHLLLSVKGLGKRKGTKLIGKGDLMTLVTSNFPVVIKPNKIKSIEAVSPKKTMSMKVSYLNYDDKATVFSSKILVRDGRFFVDDENVEMRQVKKIELIDQRQLRREKLKIRKEQARLAKGPHLLLSVQGLGKMKGTRLVGKGDLMTLVTSNFPVVIKPNKIQSIEVFPFKKNISIKVLYMNDDDKITAFLSKILVKDGRFFANDEDVEVRQVKKIELIDQRQLKREKLKIRKEQARLARLSKRPYLLLSVKGLGKIKGTKLVTQDNLMKLLTETFPVAIDPNKIKSIQAFLFKKNIPMKVFYTDNDGDANISLLKILLRDGRFFANNEEIKIESVQKIEL